MTPPVDADLYRRLFAELAAIGAGTGGWNRLAWGPAEDEARSWFIARATELQLEVEQDGAGNLWAVEQDAGSAPPSVRGHTSTRCSTAAPSTAPWAWWRRSWRSRPSAAPAGEPAAARRRLHGRRGGPPLRRRDLRQPHAVRRARRRRAARAHRPRGEPARRPRRAARGLPRVARRGACVARPDRALARGACPAGRRPRRRARRGRRRERSRPARALASLVRDTTTGWRSLDVTSSIHADYVAKRPTSQYRFEFGYGTEPVGDRVVWIGGGDCGDGGPEPANAGPSYVVVWAH